MMSSQNLTQIVCQHLDHVTPQESTTQYISRGDLTSFIFRCALNLKGNPLAIFGSREMLLDLTKGLGHSGIVASWWDGKINIENAERPEWSFEKHKTLSDSKKYWQQWNNLIFGEWTGLDIVKLIEEAKREVVNIEMYITEHDFSFHPEEYYDIKCALDYYKDFRQYYIQDSLRTNFLSEYNHTVILREDSEKLTYKVREWLTQILEIRQALIRTFKACAYQHTGERSSQITNDILDLQRKQYNVTEYIVSHGDTLIEKPSLLSLDKGKRQRFAIWQKTLEDNQLDLNLSPIAVLHDLNQQIIQSTQKSIGIEGEADLLIKSLSVMNAPMEQIRDSDRALRALTLAINELGLFSTPFEINTSNAQKLTLNCDDIIVRLETFLQYRNLKSMIKWLEVRNTLPKAVLQFFSQVKNQPQGDWGHQFDIFYFKTLLKNRIKFDLTPTLIDNIYEEYQLNCANAIHNSYNHLFKEYVDAAESQSKSISKKIQKNQVNVGELISSYEMPCPPVIMVPTDVHNVTLPAHVTQYHINSAGQGYNFMENDAHSDIPVADDINKPLSKYPITEQLEIAKMLSKKIWPFLHSGAVAIYQSKSTNHLVSTYKLWVDEIGQELLATGAKKFEVASEDDITDFLLNNDRTQLWWLQDGLMDTKRHCIAGQQAAIIAQAKNLGIEILNLSTIELYKKPESWKTKLNPSILNNSELAV